ncbi:hypothetical protein [Halocatena halophila]|uniref:hypothetical protein n=1 Tax=Halocatena halophila TaxID=2814576 RepID=UPI002ED09FEA
MSDTFALPDPPDLETALDPDAYEDATVMGEEYRRDELESFLVEGAWERAFDRWTQDTSMDEETFEIVTDLELFAEFDFFWDSFADRVGYHAPGLPEDWREREIHPAIDSWETVSTINATLTEFGQEVCDVLEAEYIDWESDYEPPDDLPEF